jgi:hypothetical protein
MVQYNRRWSRAKMTRLFDYPMLVFVATFVLLWLSAWVGLSVRTRWGGVTDDMRDDFGITLGATLTLMGLIIGFSFSMATTRYDQRKAYEEEEANAIGTEYVRVDLLPADAATQARALLVRYTDLRIRFYKTRERSELSRLNADTSALQSQLWEVVANAAKATSNTNSMLAVSGMNDVLNSQGYTQASWWNRIPTAAWSLMFAIAIVSHVLLGFGAHRKAWFLTVVLPLLVAISFLLIADIDSPRGGVITVQPQNLNALASGFSQTPQ